MKETEEFITVTEYKITDVLSVRLKACVLKDGIHSDTKPKTVVVVNGEEISQCMFLMLNIKKKETNDTFDYVNIDEMAKKYSRDLENNRDCYDISAEEEFWGHCSNLEAWAENDYNPNLLRSNLSVPLLTKLAFTNVKIFDSLLYHLDSMWKQYIRRSRKEFVHETYGSMIYELLKHHNIDIMDVYDTNAFLRFLVELTVIDKYNDLGSKVIRYVNKIWRSSDIMQFLVKIDYTSYKFKRITNKFYKKIVTKEQEGFIRKRNYWERKIWGSGTENLKYRKWLRKLRNHDVSVVSDILDYIPYIWSMHSSPEHYYPKWHDLADYNYRSKGGAKIIAEAYLAEGITHYYFLEWEYTFCNGWSGSHTLRRVIVRYKDGNFAIRHLIN